MMQPVSSLLEISIDEDYIIMFRNEYREIDGNIGQ